MFWIEHFQNRWRWKPVYNHVTSTVGYRRRVIFWGRWAFIYEYRVRLSTE